MADIEKNLIELVMSGIGAAVLGLIGFVWNISHKVNAHEKQLQAMQDLYQKEFAGLRRDIDYLIKKIDKESDKLYSIVRNKEK